MDEIMKQRFEWLKELERFEFEPVNVDFRPSHIRSDTADAIAYAFKSELKEKE